MKKAFTLAEVLITITLIGVIATITIPSVVVNTQEHEYKSGLRKAVTALNQAIAANIAMEGENAARNKDLFHYLQRHMNVVDAVGKLGDRYYVGSYNNAAFYTADGLKYMFYRGTHLNNNPTGMRSSTGGWKGYTYESLNNPKIRGNLEGIMPCFGNTANDGSIYSCDFKDSNGNPNCENVCRNNSTGKWETLEPNQTCETETRAQNIEKMERTCGGCGSRGLVENPQYNRPPCIIVVDVNGDNKPNPGNVNCKDQSCKEQNKEKYAIPTPNGGRFTDLFTIMITENKAVPYGTYAQKMMYQK